MPAFPRLETGRRHNKLKKPVQTGGSLQCNSNERTKTATQMYKISQYLKAKYAQILKYFTKYYYVKYYCEKLGAFTERLAVGKPRQSRYTGVMLYRDAHRGGLRSYKLANLCRLEPISTAQYNHYLKFLNV